MGCTNHLSGGASLPLQPRLKALLDNSSVDWAYAIFWQPLYDDDDESSSLSWADGYYCGPVDRTEEKLKAAESSDAQRSHRKTVMLELSSILSNSDPGSNSDHLAMDDDDVTDTEWFFLLSMSETVKNGNGLPGRVRVDSDLVWIAGDEELEGSGCDRARRGQGHGIKTMAFVESENRAVVELGSTEVIRPEDPSLVESVRALFDTGKRTTG